VGVQELAHLTSLSKQAASRILVDLEAKGLVEKQAGDEDGRRRSAALTAKGAAFEAAVSERLRNLLVRAYRTGGLDGVAGARAILAAMAGGRLKSPAGGGR
jgi:DNA-binding MarR family transcriptional regulator